jgi:soluble lytic murein transglycosylase-like protein
LERFGDLALALAAYNAGPNAVAKAGGIPQNGITPRYVQKVLDLYRRLCGQP